MRKQLHFNLSKILFLLLLLAGGTMWGQYSGSGTFTKITLLTDLADGYYVIANGNTPAMSNVNAGTFFDIATISPSSNVVTNPAASIVWKIETNGSGRTIYNESSSTYVSYTGSSNAAQAVASISTDAQRWTFGVSSGLFTVANVATPTRLLKYNSGAPRFACYTSGQTNLTLYKMAMPTPTVTSVAASSITATGATLNGTIVAANTTVTPSFNYGTTVSYGSNATNTTPASVTGNTSTPFSAPVTGLTVNTQYNFRAVGNNGTNYTGSNLTFYTLANVPGTVAIDGATTSSLNVTLDGTSTNGNPAATEFAIQETGGNLYVQSNGSLGASAYWATASNWQNKTVTGLAASTTYTFHAKARNGATTETAFGSTAQGQTLANSSPVLYAGTLSSFGSVAVGNTSTHMVEVFGDNLTTADVTVGPFTGFTFSTTLGGAYTSSLTFTQPGGSFASDVYVKFTPVAAQSYSGNIPVTGGGASSINIPVTATGTAPTAALSGTLNEASLNGASFTVTLTNGVFNDPLSNAGFSLNNAPAGVSIASVTYVDATTATIVLAYNNTDFDTSPAMTVTIAANQTTSNLQITSASITVTHVAETLTSAGTLAFGNVCINTTSDSQFTLTGTVKAGDISLTAATGYTFSLTNGSGYGGTLTFTASAGALNQIIYVRFSPVLVQAYTASTTISGGAANTSLTKNFTGSGINTQATVLTNAASSLSATGATLSGRVTVLGVCPASTERGFVYSATAVNAAPAVNGTGVTKIVVAGLDTSTYTQAILGLTASTGYTVRAYAYNGSAYSYGSAVTFATTPANDFCADAIQLTVGQAPISGTLVSATYTSFSNGGNYKDVWYTFTPTCSGDHIITMTTPTDDNDADIILFEGACPTNNNSNIGSSETFNNPEIITEYLTAGTVYRIRVAAYDATGESAFTIGVVTNASAASVVAGAATSIEPDGATIPVTVTAGCQTTTGNRGIVYSTSQNPTTETGTVIASGSGDGNFNAVIMGLTDNTLYYVRGYAVSDGITIYSTQISFTTNVIIAPVAIEETGLSQAGAGFTANWEDVEGAISYRLDVSTASNFGADGPASITENFETGMPDSYTTGNRTLSSGVWNFVNVIRSTTTSNNYNNSTSGAQLQGNTNSALTSPSLNKVTSVSFYAKRGTTATTVIVKKKVNGVITQIGSAISVNQTMTQHTVNINETASDVQIIIQSGGNQTLYIDAVTINYTTTIPSFVTNYENVTVSGTSHEVTGLTLGNTYHYRVRAVSANSTSANSNVIDAVAVETNFWTGNISNDWTNGANWSLGVVPTALDYASITGGANDPEIPGGMTVNVYQLLVQAGGAMNVAPETTLHVEDVITVEAGGSLTVADGASLIQVNDVDNEGNFTVQKNSNPLYRFDYTVWSSPVIGQVLQDFSPLTQANRFFEYGINPDTGNEAYIAVPSSEVFEPGKGYLIRMPHHLDESHPDHDEYDLGNAPYTHEGEYEGDLINGDVTVPLSTQANFVSMVGNPYASPINVADFFDYNEDVLSDNAGIYFWRKRNNTEATSYATLTKTSYTANDGGVESEDGDYQGGGQQWEDYYDTVSPSSWVIGAGQGFFVQGNGAAGNLTFKNVMRRSAQAGQPFFRMDNNNQPQLSRLWLNLVSETNFSQTSIAYTEGATLGVDYGMDARKFSSPNLSLYSVVGADNFTIQTRPAFEDTDVVPMGYNVNTAGTYTISLHRKDGVFEDGQNVYLKDTQLNVIHNFNEGLYTFATEAGTFNERFHVIYSDGALGTNNPVAEANTVVVYNKEKVLNVHAGNNQISAVTVYDLRGRVLYTATDINSTEAAINMQPQQQVLLVEVNTANGKVTKKVVY